MCLEQLSNKNHKNAIVQVKGENISNFHFTMSASTQNLSLRSRIAKSAWPLYQAHSRHFHVLSVLFLLPLFFSLVTYPSFHLALFHPDYDFTNFTHLNFHSTEITLPLLCSLFAVFLFLCALSTITHSTVQAFYHEPINIVSSIRSIRSSFFPLLSTFFVSHTIFISITLLFVTVFLFLVQIIQTLGFVNDLNECFMFLGIFGLTLLVPVLLWLQLNWSLAYVVAVVESKWGLEALRRSACLVKGKRLHALMMMLLLEILTGVILVCGSILLVITDAPKGNNWRSLAIILQTVQWSLMPYPPMIQYLVMNPVLYMYCNDLNSEKSPLENGNESVLDDDQKNHTAV